MCVCVCVEWRRHVRRKEAQSTMTRTAPPRGDIQPVVAEWWMLTYEPASQPTNQPASQATRMNPGDSVTDLPQSGKAGGCRLSSGAPGETWVDLMVKIQCASGGRTKQRSAGRCTRDGRVCTPRGKRREKQETRRGMREEHGERGDGRERS